MKRILILLFVLVYFEGHSQGCLKDSLVQDFVNGKLILINQLSILNTNDAFFRKLISLQFTACEVIGPEKGRELYGTLGEKGVISITLFDVEALRPEYVDIVDAGILKYFNKENPVLYHTNGIPNHDMFMALNTLINMRIEKVDIIDKAEARVIWGEQAKNGAVMITCDRKEPLSLFSQ